MILAPRLRVTRALLLALLLFASACDSGENDALADVEQNESLTSNDIDCSEDGLGSDDTSIFLVAHTVIDGDLGLSASASSMKPWSSHGKR